MEISITNIPFVISIVIAFVIVALHFVTVLCDKPFAKWLTYINILLHIGFEFAFLCAGADIETSAMCFMASIFIYTLLYYINYMIKSKKQSKINEEGEKQ